MAKYSLLIRGSAAKEIEAIAVKRDRQRIVTRIKALAENPRPPGCEKLAGHQELYRVRVGDIRIIYLIDDSNKRVEVGGAKRRTERTYRKTDHLFR